MAILDKASAKGKATAHYIAGASISATAADDILNGLGLNPRNFYAADAGSVTMKTVIDQIIVVDALNKIAP